MCSSDLASASKRREVAGFSLGPHQDRIRTLLQSRDVDGLKDYGYLLRYEREEDLRGGFLCPARTKYDGVNFVRFHGGGFCFDVKTSNGRMPDYFAPLANGPERPVFLMEYSLLETSEGRAMAHGVRRASQLPKR